MTTINLDIDSKMNEVFKPLMYVKSRMLIVFGGAGSGKSVFCPQKLIARIMTERNHKFIALRKVGATVKNSIFAEIENTIKDFGLYDRCRINKSERTFYFDDFNSQIICMGLDDPEKIKSISKPTGLWLEEATEFTYEDVQQLNLRLRGKIDSYFQVIMSFNPISALHWIKKTFFDVESDSVTILKTTYLDNAFLDDAYIKELLDMKDKDEVYYNVYALGEWGVLGNVVFTNYIVEDIKYDISDYDSLDYGMDFGFNHPSTYIKIGWKDGEPYIFQEISIKGLTNNEFIREVEQLHNKNYEITADSAEPDRIKEFRQSGFRMAASVKGKGSVKDGIDFLKRHKMHIDSKCINFQNEISTFRYKKDKDGNVHEEPVAINDDLIAAARYATEHRWKRRNSTINTPSHSLSDLGL